MISSRPKPARNVRAIHAVRSAVVWGAGNPSPLGWPSSLRACSLWCVLVSGSLRCCVRWVVLVVAVLLLVCSLLLWLAGAGLGGGWCVLVRTLGLADVEVRVVRLAQVIVVVAVRSCEAFWRPFVGSVYSGVGVEGAEIGCGGFLWGCLVCASTCAAGGGVGWIDAPGWCWWWGGCSCAHPLVVLGPWGVGWIDTPGLVR